MIYVVPASKGSKTCNSTSDTLEFDRHKSIYETICSFLVKDAPQKELYGIQYGLLYKLLTLLL